MAGIPFEDKSKAGAPGALNTAELIAKGGRVTKAQLAMRLLVVADMYFKRLMSRTDIETELSTMWECDPRTIRRYLGILHERARLHRLEFPEEAAVGVDRLRAALTDLYGRCLDAKDFRAAVQALDRLGRLEGLLGINVNINGRMAHAHLHRHQVEQPGEARALAELAGLSDEELEAYGRVTRKLLVGATAGAPGAVGGAGGKPPGSGEGKG